MIDNLYYNDINVRLSPYILSKYKKILSLLKKEVFQVINPKDVPVSIQVFNLWFIDKIEIADINKIFKKFYLIIQAYNDFNKNLIFI